MNPIIARFRELRPDYASVPDDEVAKVIGIPYERESDFVRGVNNYLPQTSEMFGAGQALAGEGLRRGLGANPVSSYLLKSGADRMHQSQKEQVSAPEDNFDTAWKKGIGSVVGDWLPYQMGQGVGNAVETITAMGLGSALGGVMGSGTAPGAGTVGGAAAGAGSGLLAKTFLKKKIIEEAKAMLATKGEEAASKYLRRELGAAVGANAGMLGDALFHGVGETGQRAIEEAKGVDGVDFNRLAPAILGHTGLEFVGDKILVGALKGKQRPSMTFQKDGFKALPANVAAGTLDIGLKEAPVEIGQTAMERYGANLPLDSEDAKTEYLNSAAAAFGMGVLPGAVGGTRSAFTRDPNYKAPFGDIPASASAGEMFGGAASRGADMVKGLYDKLVLPEASSPDMLVLNQPIDQGNPIVAVTQRNNAALRMATGLWDNPSAGADEKEAAAKFLAAKKQATTDAEQDAAALAFRDNINGVFSSRTVKSDFAQAKQDFLRGTQRRGNEQNEAGLYGFNHRPDQPLPAGQLLLRLRGGESVRHFYGEEVRPDREAVKATAQAWLRDHVNPAFPKLDIHDPEVRNGAEALFDWVAQRMPNFDKVSHAVVRMWGPEAGELVRQAHRYGVAEGIIPKNPLITERIEKAAQVLTNVAKGGSGRVEQMAQLVRPLVATKITSSLLREVDTTLRAFANGDANIDPKLLNDTLDHVFGHNKDDVFKLYEPAHNEQLDFDNVQATDNENVDDEHVDTNDWNGNIQATQGETTYHGNGAVAFDTAYPAAKLSMQKALEESPGRHTIGAWTRLKREYADNHEALTAQENDLIQKYHGLDAEGLKAQAKQHGVNVETERTSMLSAINRRAQWVADEHQSPEGVDLSARDVKNMRDTKGDIQHGRILLEQLVDDKSKPKVDESTGEMTFEKKAEPAFFSIGNIVRVMRAKRNAGALDEHGGSSKELGPAQTYRLLLAGLSSLLDTGKYTQRLGYPDKSGQVTWLQESGRLPDALYDPFTGLSIKQMREAVASERRDEGREPRTGEVAYAETHAQKLASLRDFVDSLSDRVSQMTEDGRDASKLMKYRDYLSDQVKYGAKNETKIDQLYREQRQWVPGNDAPRKTASETRIITEVHGFKEVQNKATGETEEVADARTHIFRDDPTETDEMAAQGGENTGVENRDFEHSLDRDETGQSIPERPNNAQPSPQQLAYIGKLLRKGVPTVMEFVKDMNKARFTSVLQTLRQMLRDKSALGELRNVAQNAVARMEAMAAEKRADNSSSSILHDNQRGTKEDFSRKSGETSQDREQAREGIDSVKSNAQNPVSKEVTEEEKQQVKDELLQMLGPQVEVMFQKFVKGPKGQRLSGEWMNNLIKIAIKAGDAAGVGRHEAFHQFFQWLQDAKVGNVEELFKAVTDNKLIHNQLRRLLADHPNAMKQLNDPVEAAAYLFQFWKAGLVRLGPKNETFMQRAVSFLRELTGLITQETRDLRHAEVIMQAFSDGHFAGGKDVVNAVLDKHLGEQRDAWANTFWRKLAKNDVLRKAVYTAGDVLRDTKNPALVTMADMLYTPEGGKVGGRQAYFDALPAERARRLNVLNNIMLNSDPEDFPAITKHLQEETPSTMIHDPIVRDKVEAIRGFLEDMHKYMVEKNVQRLDTETKTWVPIGKVNHYYFPRVWDASKLTAAPEEFVKLLMEHHVDQLGLIAKEHNITAQEVAEGITRRLIDNSVPDITESSSELGITPYMKSINKRSLNWIDPKVFSDFMSKDLTHILTNYTVQAVKRAEFTDRFGNEGEVLQNSINDAFLHEAFDGNASKVEGAKSELAKRLAAWNELPEDQRSRTPEPNLHDVVSSMVDQGKYEQAVESMKLPVQVVMAAEGTLGRDIDPRLQKAFGYVTAYQNLRLLALALFSSFGDPLGIVVRGGTMKEAYEAFSYGVKEVVLGWKGQLSSDEKAKLAEKLGTVDAGNFLDALGQTYSSLYMYENLRKTNDAMFKWNGMEAWNRAMRIQATQAAIGFIEKHLSNPNEHSERYLKDELGLRDKDAAYLKDGKLDTDNAQVREAIVRWVNGAILRPNAMQRPIVASDPHYQLFYHLKQFTYSFHKTILQRVVVEYKHGNLTPAMALVSTYVPLMVAADVLKELLVPGDDPAWMKAGLGGIVRHGVERANLFGVPQMFAGSVGSPLEPTGSLHKAAGLFGPSASEVVDWALLPFNDKDSFGKELARSVPLSQIVSRAATLAD